jgi:hypothetical protein
MLTKYTFYRNKLDSAFENKIHVLWQPVWVFIHKHKELNTLTIYMFQWDLIANMLTSAVLFFWGNATIHSTHTFVKQIKNHYQNQSNTPLGKLPYYKQCVQYLQYGMFSTVYRIPFRPFSNSWLLTWVLSPVCRQKAMTWWSYMTCLWPCYTNMSTRHVLGHYSMSTWCDISVALLHQYVSTPWDLLHQPVNMTWHVCGFFDQHANTTWHVCGPIILTYQHDMICLWPFIPICQHMFWAVIPC